ncbi:MAG: hypothetical protein ACD_30C00002G0014 [uncultured bacterium]|uniref:30S ribosomal protein S17 n=3 Tax=Candidatus Daviesiibacteriota TaxID=1752718 RepID=A0A1F5K1J5_9BACT|nr:MAG: hypothetical protein ACD_30C00002G0014 [uncultured bacterium]KKQ15787.1 MAG: 30S ribosomal protein S17 [Candidatus Daviesbacteria bacterium GW2011_GWA1_36_8]OGE16567.1 MAG: 30S ribosomal protein S17 [Candidatus Daviesbacteria bacterium RIFCSPHIGHO2_01_FULL_36_37]OGE31752.1 MAG: 30S ribosomal protein S17 [Candidatus Daviesbacteria bacterium RIFCSPHIGHO2_02_FULL_37_9]OGE34650.1 MAG: 30S ribosomal protein S17 [Candidatus Daviesbacteria bacterium RIFCSPHIGHO2_12_FULL_37_16]
MIGRVVSVKMTHSASVLIEGKKTHHLYKKSFVWSKKYLADDPIGVKPGDIVEVIKTKPISKRKHWLITNVVGSDFVAIAQEHLKEEAEEAIEEVMPVEEEESSEVSLQSSEKTEKIEDKEEVKEKKPRKRKEKSES